MKRFCVWMFLVCCLVGIIGNVSVLASDLFFIESVAYKGLSWDLRGNHLSAERKGGKILINGENNHADRYIKVIPHETKREYVFFQPQHSFLVTDITNDGSDPGEQLQLWEYGKNNIAQMFKMIPVPGEADTYLIQNAGSQLYLTAHGKNQPITQENKDNHDDQKWHFKQVDGTTMTSPNASYMYAIENVRSKKFIDVPGIAPNQKRENARLQLWDLDDGPDRYVELYDAGDGYFVIHPLHSTEVWNVENGSTATGTPIGLGKRNDTSAQQFKFEYAGEPLTYYIKNRSGKYLDASLSQVDKNGCPITIYPLNDISKDVHTRDHQKWRLHVYDKWQLPPNNQTFYIKSAYINKYWDLSGTGSETNKLGKKFTMWDLDNGGDRKFKILPSGSYSWVNLQVQNGGRYVDVPKDTKESGANLILWDRNGANNQKFAVQFTSPTTFALRTHNWLTADIRGGTSEEWQKNGAELIQWSPHYHANQQFQLVYADGSNKGRVYQFPELNEKTIYFTGARLTDEQKKRLRGNQGRSYTYFPDADGDLILAVYLGTRNTGGYGIQVTKVVEVGDRIEVYVQEKSPKPGQINTQALTHPSTIVKMATSNENIVIKDADGNDYKYFLPLTYNPGLYFIESVAYQGLSWDLKGVHYAAERHNGGKFQLYSADNGADRFIKIIPHESRPDYVWFQPQHSYLVADFADGTVAPGAELQLDAQEKFDSGQMFKLIEVSGEWSTYYIQNAKSGLYLTAHDKSHPITQESYQGSDQQKWKFKTANPTTMAPPSKNYMYAIENVMAKKFIDVPGRAPNQARQDGELQLWSLDDAPDRYVELYSSGVAGYFNIHPLHSTEVWDVEGGHTGNGTVLQLWGKKNTANQQFKFVYAGEPMTYYIQDRNSGKYLDASRSKIGENGCPIQIYTLNDISTNEHARDNQKWRLTAYSKWQMPPEDQAFYIKAAYIDKYWDLSGTFSKVDTYGLNYHMWNFDTGGDRKFKIKPSGDGSWVNLEIQINPREGVRGPYVDIEGRNADQGARIEMMPYKADLDSQKFAIEFTSPTTFALRTPNWFAVDIKGGNSDDWKKNGAALMQSWAHFRKNQQFQLVYADGPKKGQVYSFKQINFGALRRKKGSPEVIWVRTERNEGKINLNWTAHLDQVRGFNVYRSNSLTGEKVLLNDKLISEYCYVDATADETTPYYYYWVQAIRRDEKEAVMSRPVPLMNTKTVYEISLLAPQHIVSNQGIWRINTDGTELTLINTGLLAPIEDFVSSPSGYRIGFTVKNKNNSYFVYTMRRDGSGLHKVKYSVSDQDFTTSAPMIKMLENYRFIVKDDAIYANEAIPNYTDLLCGISQSLQTGSMDEIHYYTDVKSPIAFDIFDDEIFYISKEGTHYTLKKYQSNPVKGVSVIDANTTSHTPVVSRGTANIYYLDYHDNTTTTGIFALQNSDDLSYNYQSSRVSLTPKNQQCYALALSADNQKLAYVAVENSVANLYMMNVDGSNRIKLADHVTTDGSPAWLPDGSGIVYLKKVRGGYSLNLYSFENQLSFELAKTTGAKFEIRAK